MAYPTNLETLATNAVDGDDAGDDTPGSILVGPHSDKHNTLARLLNTLQSVLGTNPQGGSTDVKSRIAAAEVVGNAAIPKALVTAAGDLIYATAAGVLARRAIGAAGKFLSSDGTAPVWADPPSTDAIVSVDKDGSLVGIETGIDFVAGSGITITATDDPAASLVHLTFAATGGGGGVSGGADYILSVSGGTVTATSPIGLATVSGSDAGSVLQTCITNLGASGGTIVFQKGTYAYNAVVPALPVDLTGWLRIVGNGAKITLASGARRFLDIGRTASGQTLRYIEVGGFSIDGGGQTGSHSVIGTNQNGTLTTGDIAIDQLWIHDIQVTNLPSTNDATSDRSFIHFYNTSSSTVRYDNVLLQRINIVGGDSAILFVGNTNTTVGLLVLEYVSWDRNLAPNGATTSYGFQLSGINGQAERIVLVYCTAKQAPYYGFYVTNCRSLDARNCYAENCWNAGYAVANNNSTPTFIAVQRNAFRGCEYRMTGTFVGNNSTGWRCQPITVPFGELVLDGCTGYSTSTGTPLANQVGYGGLICDSSSANIRAITIIRHKYVVDALTWAVAATQLNFTPLSFQLPTGRTTLSIQDLTVDVTGTRTVSGANDVSSLVVNINAADLLLTIDGYDYSFAIANQGLNLSRALVLGDSSIIATQKIRGVVSCGRVVTFGGGDTTPRFAMVNRTNSATIMADANSWVRFLDCDFANFPGTAGEIFIGANSKPFVSFDRVRWLVYPVASSTITPGASPYAYQNLDGYGETVTVSGGTVSAIDISQDGTTYRSAGVTAGVFHLEAAQYLKVTYSATPTMTKIPDR